MSVYEIPDEPHPADGWTPGLPGRELGTETPATEWELPTPTPVAAPPRRRSDPAKPVYTVDERPGGGARLDPDARPHDAGAPPASPSALGAGHGSGADPFGDPGEHPSAPARPPSRPPPRRRPRRSRRAGATPASTTFDELTSRPASGGAAVDHVVRLGGTGQPRPAARGARRRPCRVARRPGHAVLGLRRPLHARPRPLGRRLGALARRPG